MRTSVILYPANACLVWYTNVSIGQHRNNFKRCLQTICPGYPYENILQTLHHKLDELCRVYFGEMPSSDHRLNALVPTGRSGPYALRLCNKLPVPRAEANIYTNSLKAVVFRAFSDRLVLDKYFDRQCNLIICLIHFITMSMLSVV